MRPVTMEYDASDRSTPQASAPLATRGGRFGDYRVLMPLARGGTGGVYLAVHVITGHQVAIKVLDPQFAGYADLAARLCAEVELSARARHPGVVTIHAAAWSADAAPYLVMEYLDGESLATICERGTVDVDFAIAIGAQVAA
ncbi:MAG: protein kinase, partial [Proteobacteria bacterium]|nr:protein kinase [Pseudomonadota bacterium]